MFRRKFWTFGEGGVKDSRIRAGNQQARGVAGMVMLNLASGRIRRVFRITAGPQRGLVQQRPAVQVQNKNRRFGSGGIDFFQGRHPAFGKLKFGPAADHPYPLAGWRALRLFLQHPQGVRERWNAVPAQFHVVIQAAANHMKM